MIACITPQSKPTDTYFFALGFWVWSFQSYRLTGSIGPVSATSPSPSASGLSSAPIEPPKPFKEQWVGWSYDGSQSINRSNVFFFVNPDGIRIPSTDSLFEGITLSEPSSCAAKLQIGKDFDLYPIPRTLV